MEPDPVTRCPACVSIPGPILLESDALPTELPGTPIVFKRYEIFLRLTSFDVGNEHSQVWVLAQYPKTLYDVIR